MSGKSEQNGSTETEKKVDLGELKSNLKAGCGCLFVFILGIAAYQGCTATDTAVAPKATPAAKPLSKAETLKSMTAKISDIALEPLDRKYDPEGYAKVGKRVWDTSNELRRWAGLAALQNSSCTSVSAIALWERATRSQVSWHVVCGTDERFVISERQARSARAMLDPKATDADRKKYGTMAAAKAMSAAFTGFNVVEAVTACDSIMKEASVDKGSFDTSWAWDEARDEEAGQAIISREYSAKNAMGGMLSGKYECTVDAASNRVVGLKARDAFGLHTVL